MLNSGQGAPLERRRSSWLGSTMMGALLISGGVAEAQEARTAGQATPSQQVAPPDQTSPNLPPVTVTRPARRVTTATPTGEGTGARRANRQAPRTVQQQPPPAPQAPAEVA